LENRECGMGSREDGIDCDDGDLPGDVLDSIRRSRTSCCGRDDWRFGEVMCCKSGGKWPFKSDMAWPQLFRPYIIWLLRRKLTGLYAHDTINAMKMV
jgi:hypothetical protein